MLPFRSIIALASLAGFAASVAVAQVPHGGFGPKRAASTASQLNIEVERAEQVEAILAAARVRGDAARQQIGEPRDETARAALHAALEAIRTDTEQKLQALLTADEMARLRTALPPSAEPMRFKKG